MKSWLLFSFAEILVCAISVFSFLAWRTSRRTQKILAAVEETFQTIAPQVQALFNADISIGKRFQELQQHYDILAKEVDQLKHHSASAPTYNQAIKLAEMGATLDEIQTSCQLSKAESELVMSLQVYKQILDAQATTQ